MQGCQECLAYLIHHGLVQPDICPECHEKALYWKQSEFGTFFLACTNCSTTIAVDLNTPCEEDPVFHQTLQIVVMPSSVVFNNQKLLELAKVFDVNTIQIYRMLKQGFTMDIQVEKLEETTRLMTGMGIDYRLPQGFCDPRERYYYYKHCRYPYSTMRIYLR